MVAWPAALPQEQFLGLTDQRQSATIRSSITVGEPHLRKMFTAVTRKFSIPITLSGAQRQTFDAFWIDDLVEGVLEFDWEDPVDDVTVPLRFTGETNWQLISGGSVTTRVWNGVLQLEILP